MTVSSRVRRALDILFFPGLLMHELAHAVVVIILPNVRMTGFDVSLQGEGEVNYEYTHMTAIRKFLIAYAPFYVNTSIATYLTYLALELQPSSGVIPFLKSALLLLLTVSLAAKATPSSVDAVAPVGTLRRHLLSLRLPAVLLFGPIVLLVSIPAIVVSHIREYSTITYYGMSLMYAIVLMMLVYLTYVGAIEPTKFIESAVQLYAVPAYEFVVAKVSQYVNTF